MTEHDMRQLKEERAATVSRTRARVRTHAHTRATSKHLEHTRNTLLKLIAKYVLSMKGDLKGKGKTGEQNKTVIHRILDKTVSHYILFHPRTFWPDSQNCI